MEILEVPKLMKMRRKEKANPKVRKIYFVIIVNNRACGREMLAEVSSS